MPSPRLNALLLLHLTVFLWGFTAILGKAISYGSFLLVWHRMCLTALVYFCIPAVWRSVRKMPLRQIAALMGIGLVVCIHWLSFYGSIKLGNSASITLACLGSASFFAAILEPLLNKTPFRPVEIVLGLLVLAGILLIYHAMPASSGPDLHYPLAIAAGVFSAFLAALFTVLNKRAVHKTETLTLSALEMLSGAIVLSLLVPFLAGSGVDLLPRFAPAQGNYDLLWLLILVLVCTNLTFYMGTHALRELSAFTANLTVNLEPVYGIVLGVLIFHENQQLNLWFYLGTALILLAVLVQTVFFSPNAKNRPPDIVATGS
jgi:drug/metabolite transporter (DMT)-like permease